VRPDTRQRVDDFWTARLGCPPDPLSANRITVMAHAGLRDLRGVYLLRRGEAVLISAPAPFADLLREAVRGASAARVSDRSFLPRVLDSAAGEVIAASLVPQRRPEARSLGPGDRAALDALRSALSTLDWEQGGLDAERPPLFGAHVSGALAAAAGYRTLLDRVAHLGVVAHPAHRGAGLGRAVASAAAEHALERGLLLQWQALEANRAALRVAERLGFERYARSLVVRLDLTGAR
jgi:GNAT superfamily N-acetyltransferase